MSRGRRYSGEGKLNIKKVVAVLIALALIVIVVISITKLLGGNKVETKVVATEYFAAYADGKWGVIDSKGKEIVKPSYNEAIIVPNSTEAVFICTYDVNYETNEYKTKAINEKKDQLFTEYDGVQAIENYDVNNNLWYEDDVLLVNKDGKYGLIDFDGKVLANCEYDSITALRGVENTFVTEKDGKKGLVDNIGAVIAQNNYKDIKTLTDKASDGYILIDENDKCGLVKLDKTVVFENNYQDIKQVYGDNKYVVRQNGKWSVADKDGNLYLTGEFDDVTSINGDNVIAKKGNKYGVLSTGGEIIINFDYDDMSYTYENNYIAKKDNKYGIINVDGTTKVDFKYDSLIYRQAEGFFEGSMSNSVDNDLIDRNFEVKLSGIISEINDENGYMKVRVDGEYKYYNFRFEEKTNIELLKGNTLFLSKKDDKYGFVNKDGIVIVDYIYDDATEQNRFGYSSVKKDGKWGAIDSQGRVVVEPQYTMDNNLLIEFIDEWHLGEDLNLNYYTK